MTLLAQVQIRGHYGSSETMESALDRFEMARAQITAVPVSGALQIQTVRLDADQFAELSGLKISDDGGRTFHNPWTLEQIEHVTDVKCGRHSVEVAHVRRQPDGLHYDAPSAVGGALLAALFFAVLTRRAGR